jgi:hypothetical protein
MKKFIFIFLLLLIFNYARDFFNADYGKAWGQAGTYTVYFEFSADERDKCFDGNGPPAEFCAHIQLYDSNKTKLSNVVYKWVFKSNDTVNHYQKITKHYTRTRFNNKPAYFSMFLYENDRGGMHSYDTARFQDSDDKIWDNKWTYTTSTDKTLWGANHFYMVKKQTSSQKLFSCNSNKFYCFRNPNNKDSMKSWSTAKNNKGHVKVRVWVQ